MVSISRLYTHVFFDLYGTLFDIRVDEDRAELWEKLQAFLGARGAHYDSVSELKETYELALKETTNHAIEAHGIHAEIDVAAVFDVLYSTKNMLVDESVIAKTASFFREHSTTYLELYPQAREMLYILRRMGVKSVLVSNAQSLYTIPELYEFNLPQLFDQMYMSSDYGVKKPSRDFFDAVLEGCGAERSHVLMVGNELGCDIYGATQSGLDAVYMHTNLSVEGDPVTTPEAVCNIEGAGYGQLLSYLCDEEVVIEGEGSQARVKPVK